MIQEAASQTPNATQVLPPGYELAGVIDLAKDRRLMVVMNFAGVVLLLVFTLLFTMAAAYLRPDTRVGIFEFSAGGALGFLMFIALVLLITVIMVLVHEGIHGLFFWLATRTRPKFGFKGVYAYASAPDWYIARNTYAWIGLSPFVLITVFGLLLIKVVPEVLISPLLALLIFNGAGAVGDLIMVGWLLTKPASAIAQDYGDGVRLFVQRA